MSEGAEHKAALARKRARSFNANIMWRYGITREQWSAMLVEQSGRCYICEDPMDEPNVDHCHETGEVRKLLCRRCNLAAGWMRDCPDTVMALHQYLIEHKPC